MSAPAAAVTREELATAFAVLQALAEAVREAKEIPSGHLYAMVCDKMELRTYESIVGILKRSGLVEEKHHLLRWIGPELASKKPSAPAPAPAPAPAATIPCPPPDELLKEAAQAGCYSCCGTGKVRGFGRTGRACPCVVRCAFCESPIPQAQIPDEENGPRRADGMPACDVCWEQSNPLGAGGVS